MYRSNPYSIEDIAVDAPTVCIFHQLDGLVCMERCGDVLETRSEPSAIETGLVVDHGEVTVGLIPAPGDAGLLLRSTIGAAAEPTQLAFFQYEADFRNLVRRGDFLYFYSPLLTNDVGLYRLPYEGGVPERMSDWEVPDVHHGIAAGQDTLYLISNDRAHRGLYSMPLSGGMPQLLQSTIGDLTNVAANTGYVTWTESGPDGVGGTMYAMTAGGQGVIPLLRTDGRPVDLVVDDTRVYVVIEDQGQRNIVATTVPGGVRTILSGQNRIEWLAQDIDYLYYLGEEGVYRLRKP